MSLMILYLCDCQKILGLQNTKTNSDRSDLQVDLSAVSPKPNITNFPVFID